jgi:hypothetical protein
MSVLYLARHDAMKEILNLRFRIQFLVTAFLLGLQSFMAPMIISAAGQETPRRHSLIHRSDLESAALPATTQGTILQPPSAEQPHIMSPIEPPNTLGSLPIMPHHRTLTKRPPVASIAAPSTFFQTIPGPLPGQILQTATDTTKSTLSPAVASITKSMPSLAGVISTGAAPITSTPFSPLASSTSMRSAATVGSNPVPSSNGSRSALNLLQNSAIAGLLQPSTPVVTTRSSPPPSSAPGPLPSLSTGSVTLTWAANGESDLAGYKIYVGTASGIYDFPVSAFVIGKVTSYTVANLPIGQTYFFAMSAYDTDGNESSLSAEVSKSLF